MEEISFRVQGSVPEAYVVRFSRNGNSVRAHCTCPAGVVGQSCKHRTRIIEGIHEGIVSGNEGDVSKVATWIQGSDLERALNDVREADIRLEAAKKELAVYKKRLARALTD